MRSGHIIFPPLTQLVQDIWLVPIYWFPLTSGIYYEILIPRLGGSGIVVLELLLSRFLYIHFDILDPRGYLVLDPFVSTSLSFLGTLVLQIFLDPVIFCFPIYFGSN